jgi:hypothetical protein
MVVAMVLVMLISGPAMAGSKGKVTRDKGTRSQVERTLGFLKGIDLTSEQKTKVEGLKSEYGLKMTEAKGKIDSILTAEQKQARRDAQRAAKAAGKTGKAAKAEIEAAVKFTDDQKTKWSAANQQMKSLKQDLRSKAEDLLTADQKTQITKPYKKGRK